MSPSLTSTKGTCCKCTLLAGNYRKIYSVKFRKQRYAARDNFHQELLFCVGKMFQASFICYNALVVFQSNENASLVNSFYNAVGSAVEGVPLDCGADSYFHC